MMHDGTPLRRPGVEMMLIDRIPAATVEDYEVGQPQQVLEIELARELPKTTFCSALGDAMVGSVPVVNGVEIGDLRQMGVGVFIGLVYNGVFLGCLFYFAITEAQKLMSQYAIKDAILISIGAASGSAALYSSIALSILGTITVFFIQNCYSKIVNGTNVKALKTPKEKIFLMNLLQQKKDAAALKVMSELVDMIGRKVSDVEKKRVMNNLAIYRRYVEGLEGDNNKSSMGKGRTGTPFPPPTYTPMTNNNPKTNITTTITTTTTTTTNNNNFNTKTTNLLPSPPLPLSPVVNPNPNPPPPPLPIGGKVDNSNSFKFFQD